MLINKPKSNHWPDNFKELRKYINAKFKTNK